MLCRSLDHLTRRTWMKGVLGTGGGALVMNWGGLTSAGGLAEQVQRVQKHCILLWMNGGISPFETFDMKTRRRTGRLFPAHATEPPRGPDCQPTAHRGPRPDPLART